MSAIKPRSRKVKLRSKSEDHRAELWQDGMMVACVEGPDEAFVATNINHYALMYGQDGLVEIRYYAPGAKR